MNKKNPVQKYMIFYMIGAYQPRDFHLGKPLGFFYLW